MTKFMGETSAKLRLIFDAIQQTRGVYLFDEFDSIASTNQGLYSSKLKFFRSTNLGLYFEFLKMVN